MGVRFLPPKMEVLSYRPTPPGSSSVDSVCRGEYSLGKNRSLKSDSPSGGCVQASMSRPHGSFQGSLL